MSDDGPSISELVAAVRASGRYEVLALLQRHERYDADDGSPKKLAAFVDVETTGLDAKREAIIEFGMVTFEYAPDSGRIYRVHDAVSYLEDPRRPIPSDIRALTGITDEMVAGRSIDEAHVYQVLGAASLVISHNAAFDRPFVERRLRRFADRHWACSMTCVPWRAYGLKGSLELLLYKHARVFLGHAHRAADDCFGGVHVLATPFADGTRPMQHLLAAARQRTGRLWAVGSRIEIRDVLKARGYKWSPGGDGRRKCWYIEVPEDAIDAERQWLAAEVFAGNGSSIVVEKVDARTRYTDRAS